MATPVDPAEHVGIELVRHGWTLAVAESCTGGLLGSRITEVAGSSRYFLGGIIAYDNGIKSRLLGVDANLLAREGAVSPAVARAMAAGVRRAVGSTAGIGITGVAGPGGGTPGKPVGLVYVALALGDAVDVRELRLSGDRRAVRRAAAEAALDWLLECLRELDA